MADTWRPDEIRSTGNGPTSEIPDEMSRPSDPLSLWRARLWQPIANAGRALADIVLPPVCLACHHHIAAHDCLCGECWRDVHFIRQPMCDVLGIPLPATDLEGRIVSAAALANPPDYDRARAVAHFSGAMRKLVHQFKYNDRQETRALFGRWLMSTGTELIEDADMIIPVPLNRRRLLWRRFNQSAVLALEVAQHASRPYEPTLLHRVKRTAPQVGLSQVQRRDNVRGAFRVSKAMRPRLEGQRVLLIEDVITTGATVNACARELKRAGAQRVDVLALGLVTDESRALASE
jgi:ComF family protein